MRYEYKTMKYNFQIPLANGDVDLLTIEGGTAEQAERSILKQYPHCALTCNGDGNYVGQAPVAPSQNNISALPVPSLSFEKADNQVPSVRCSSVPGGQTGPANHFKPVEGQVLNDVKALPLPAMNFEKTNAKKSSSR
jgi:hypothetical protein